MSVLEQQTVIPAGVYAADPTHSSVEFSIRHMGLATVRGRAADFSASLDASGQTPVLEGTIETAGITTHDEQRDGHLGSPDFFDAERYPRISFHSTAIDLDGDHGTLTGELTIKGTSKPVQLAVVVTGAGEDPWATSGSASTWTASSTGASSASTGTPRFPAAASCSTTVCA